MKNIDRKVFVVDADEVVAFGGVFLVNNDSASTQTSSQILTKDEMCFLIFGISQKTRMERHF